MLYQQEREDTHDDGGVAPMIISVSDSDGTPDKSPLESSPGSGSSNASSKSFTSSIAGLSMSDEPATVRRRLTFPQLSAADKRDLAQLYVESVANGVAVPQLVTTKTVCDLDGWQVIAWLSRRIAAKNERGRVDFGGVEIRQKSTPPGKKNTGEKETGEKNREKHESAMVAAMKQWLSSDGFRYGGKLIKAALKKKTQDEAVRCLCKRLKMESRESVEWMLSEAGHIMAEDGGECECLAQAMEHHRESLKLIAERQKSGWGPDGSKLHLDIQIGVSSDYFTWLRSIFSFPLQLSEPTATRKRWFRFDPSGDDMSTWEHAKAFLLAPRVHGGVGLDVKNNAKVKAAYESLKKCSGFSSAASRIRSAFHNLQGAWRFSRRKPPGHSMSAAVENLRKNMIERLACVDDVTEYVATRIVDAVIWSWCDAPLLNLALEVEEEEQGDHDDNKGAQQLMEHHAGDKRKRESSGGGDGDTSDGVVQRCTRRRSRRLQKKAEQEQRQQHARRHKQDSVVVDASKSPAPTTTVATSGPSTKKKAAKKRKIVVFELTDAWTTGRVCEVRDPHTGERFVARLGVQQMEWDVWSAVRGCRGVMPLLVRGVCRIGGRVVVMPWMSTVGDHRRYHRNPDVGVLKQLCGTLAEVHDRGVLHRDIHWDNIMLNEDASKAYLAGFDRSVLLSKLEKEEDWLEPAESELVPEMGHYSVFSTWNAANDGPLSASDDWHSLAMMLAYMYGRCFRMEDWRDWMLHDEAYAEQVGEAALEVVKYGKERLLRAKQDPNGTHAAMQQPFHTDDPSSEYEDSSSESDE